jgi:hypothetical protein
VAINDFGEVAFHGRVVDLDAGGDGVKAVFTSDGLVAKKEGPLPGGTIVSDIDVNGGVAINFDGQVAFHGKVGTTDVVLVGQAPLPPALVPLAEGDESSRE